MDSKSCTLKSSNLSSWALEDTQVQKMLRSKIAKLVMKLEELEHREMQVWDLQ